MKKNKVTILLILAGFLLFIPNMVKAGPSQIKLKVITELANIRSNPDIGSTVICQLPLNTILESTKKEGEWYAVTFTPEKGETISGYVHESLVLVLEEEPVRIVRETIKPVESPPEKKDAQVEKPSPVEKKAAETARREKHVLSHAIVPSTIKKSKTTRFDILLSGGLSYMGAGILNKGAQGLADYYQKITTGQGPGEISSLHWAGAFGAEFNFSVFPKTNLGIGIDFLSGKKESLFEIPDSTPDISIQNSPNVQVVPISLTVTVFPFSHFYAKTGIEILFAECGYSYLIQEGEAWQKWEGTAKGQNMGFLGAVGLEWKLHSFLSLFVEIKGRTSRIRSLKGKDTYTDSGGLTAVEEGTLYLYQTKTADGKFYDLLFIRNKRPAEAGVYNAEEAVLDLSGISLRTGFKIKF
ncbi:MAG: SH3 domain-containing protein [Candidatus Aminicenantes bacterium]|nr:SH3 domain-containing protein [Candidatus Aminicenantes bacterium]